MKFKKPNAPILRDPESIRVDCFEKNPRSIEQAPSETGGGGPRPSKEKTKCQESQLSI